MRLTQNSHQVSCVSSFLDNVELYDIVCVCVCRGRGRIRVCRLSGERKTPSEAKQKRTPREPPSFAHDAEKPKNKKNKSKPRLADEQTSTEEKTD